MVFGRTFFLPPNQWGATQFLRADVLMIDREAVRTEKIAKMAEKAISTVWLFASVKSAVVKT